MLLLSVANVLCVPVIGLKFTKCCTRRCTPNQQLKPERVAPFQLEQTVWQYIFQNPTIEVYWISCKLCLSAKSTPFHWLLICFIGASPDWQISLVHQPAMTLNVTRTCMKPCNIPLSLGPKKRKGTPWFNAAFTCHVLRVLVGLANSSNRGRKKVKTKRLWCHAVLYKCSICIYKTFRLLHVVVTMHDVDSGHSL